jgi:hypothetical protein
MPKFDTLNDPVLERLYRGQRRVHDRGTSPEWYAGLLAHVQRADSRELKDAFRSLLAQHVGWYTREFDDPGQVPPEDLRPKLQELEEKGFTYFNLPPDTIEGLLKSLGDISLNNADNTDTVLVRDDLSQAKFKFYTRCLTDDTVNLINFPDLVKIAANRQILALARHYLGALPRFASAEISLNNGRGQGLVPSSDWHYDKGSLSFLKMFIYLNDVSVDSGPHAYITQSHDAQRVRNAVDERFSDDDPARELASVSRWSDADANVLFPMDQIVHTGPAGLAILEDTRGFHRAIKAVNGYRLMITLEWGLDVATTGAPCASVPYESLDESIKPKTELAEKRFRYIFSEFIS